MSQNEKPLPKPPSTPFTRKRAGQHNEEQEPLTADRMAQAMAEGKLDEFLQKEMPDNEAARKMATMMMGMTGMMPMGGPAMAPPSPAQQQPTSSPEMNASEQIAPPGDVPEDVRRAIESGDVKGLKDLLRREYLKRTPGATFDTSEEAVAPPPPQASGMPTIDKELIDAMIQIAKDNSVTMDWMILRAIKVYVEEYRKTGKL
jgi:predicted amidohydrolase YtcJ